jgi:L-aspartate oxidase
MSPRLDATREADVVVVGAGAAGLSVVLGTRQTVDLLAKGPLGRTGNSPWAQGGIAGAVGPDDSSALHAADTLGVAGEIADAAAVAALMGDGPRRLAELVRLGARFDRDGAGRLDLAREAAHSRRRILHSRDATGAEVVRALGAALVRRSGLSVFEQSRALELVLDGGRVAGLLARHADGALVLHRARAVVLATGGIGQLYARTTNPPEATGDGLALAWRAGARLADVEMVQFHPTALDCGADPMPLLTEALRGAGARLVDEHGEPLLQGPGAELQARDVVSRGIWSALARGRRAFLDARAAVGESFPHRFPTVFEACRAHGIDPRVGSIPVAPAAHYHMGGIATDLDGRTSVPGLWAAGEAACTGVHGANRLASNSLLEALVFGARVARSISLALPGIRRPCVRVEPPDLARWRPDADAGDVRRELRALTWETVGLVRTADGLRCALDRIDALEHTTPADACETRSLLTVARLLATAALARPESRGAHFRADHPEPDAGWKRRIVLTRRAGPPLVETEPVTVRAAAEATA